MSEKKFSDLIAKVSDLSVTELSALTSKHRDLDAVSAELKRAADSVSAPDAKKRVYTLLAIISDLHFRERDDAQPYGPNVSWSDGRRSPIPEDLSDEQIALIWELLPSIQSPSLKGLLADLLWLEKRPSTRPHLKLIAETAMDSYIEAATYDLISDNDFELIRWLKRATRIARQIQADESIFEKIKEIYRQALGKESNCDKPGVLHRLIKLGLEANLQDSKILSDLCVLSAKKIEAVGNWESAVNFWGMAFPANDADNQHGLNIASCYERAALAAAKKENYFAAVHYQEKAIEAYRRVGNTKPQRLAAQKLLKQWQPLLKSSLKPITHEIGISDLIEGSRAAIRGKTFYQAILTFVRIASPPKLDKIIANVKEQNEKFVLSGIFGGTVLDSEGKTVYKYGPLFGHEARLDDPSFRHRVVQESNMYQSLTAQAQITPCVAQITSEHRVTDTLLLPIVQSSPFVPNGYEHVFCEAFRLAFEGQVMLTLHLLLPQIENSLRHILQQHGTLTFRIKPDGIHEDLNLNEMLYGPCGTKLAEIFGKDTLFDLQSLLVERSGPNLRNVVAHGKASVAMMYSGSSWYLFWLILRFCCIPLFQHWEKFEAAEQPLEVPDHD